MMPAGLQAIESAKAIGAYDVLNISDSLEISDDLAAGFQNFPTAEDNFSAFPKSLRRAIFMWIHGARTAETRARRILKTAQDSANNKRPLG